jgi:hypothetical protein
MGFKRDREKERLKKHHKDQKIARTRRQITTIPYSFAGVDQLATSHIKRILDNPEAFKQYPGLHQMAADIMAERALNLERER